MKSMLILFNLLAGILITFCKPPVVQTHPGYPEFSWDKVQQFGFATIKPDNPLSKEQIRFIAENFAIVTLNKQKTADNESIMPEVSALAKELKSINPRIKILCYLNTVIAYQNSPIADEFQKHPGWVLTDSTGSPFLIRHLKTFNLSDPDVREFWAAGCAKMVSYPFIDGVFADAVPKYGMKNHPDLKKAFSLSEMDALSRGEYELLKLTQGKIGEDKLLIFNGIRGDLEGWSDGGLQFLDHASGCMVEHFCAITTRDTASGNLKTEMVVNDIELIGKASEMGKIVLVKGWPGNWSWLSAGYNKLNNLEKYKIAEENLDFALAAFLVAAGENCNFEYSFGYTENDGIFEHYDLLDRRIGKPLGKAEKKGLIYTREFEHCEVWVDIGEEKARIEWEE